LGDTALGPTVLPFARADIERTIPARFEQAAAHFSDHIALTGRGRTWTYRDLNEQANRIAHAIRRQVPSDAECVAQLIDQSPGMVVAAIAAMKAGCASLAIHPAMPARAQSRILEDAGPALLLATTATEGRARELALGRWPVVNLDDVDDRWPRSNPARATGPGDPAIIFYTSGSTGQPKGVVKSHRAILHRVWLSTQYDRITPSDRHSLLTHSSFASSMTDTFASLLQGARVCVFDVASEGLLAFRQWLEEQAVTLLHPPALLFRRFLSTLEGSDLFPSIRIVAIGGDVVLTSDLEKWRRHFSPGCVLFHRLAATETALMTVARVDANTSLESDLTLAGHPVADKGVSVVDEAGQTVEAGEPGELQVSSRYISDGYWRRPEQTAAAFRPDPDVPERRVYRTGDRARFLPDGRLMFLGRRDHLVKIRGYRVELREIDAALLNFAEISEAATIPVKLDDEQRLAAFVVLKPGSEFDALALRMRLAAHLPEWKIPAALYSLQSLPTTLTGKVDRQRLEAEIRRSAPSPGAAADRPPSLSRSDTSSLEAKLAELAASVVGIDRVGRDDDLRALGLDSLRVIVLLSRAEQEFGKRVIVTDFLKSPTIGRLAELLETAGPAGVPDEIEVIRRGAAPAGLFFVHGLLGWIPHAPYLPHLPAEMPAYGLRLVPGTDEEPLDLAAARHVRAMLAVQPNGPYHLMGFSYGAHLAYEVACKLAAAQQSVGLLALVDAPPGFERLEPMAGEHLIRGDMRIARPELDHRAYAHVPARILYFRSSFRFEASYLLPGGGWEELALGGVETVRITGGHLGTVVDPVAAAIGRIVREALGGPAAAPSPQVLHRGFVEHTGTESSWRIAARKLARAGDLPGQLELYRRALSRNPQQPAWVIVNFARLCGALDRTELLDPIAAWLTDRCTADARFAYAMAIVHSVCGRRSLAAATFRQSAQLEPHDPAPFVQLAREADSAAEQDEALRAALAKAPTDPGLRVHLAQDLLNHDRFAAALELLHEATAMPGSDDWIQEQVRDAEVRWRRRQEYDRLVERVCRLVSASTPDGTTALVISKGDPGFLAVDGRTARHFPCDATGEYRGYYPADSREAVNDLEHLRTENATYLVVPAPSLWWLDHYVGFQQHLHTRYRLLVDDESCRIFDLRSAP